MMTPAKPRNFSWHLKKLAKEIANDDYLWALLDAPTYEEIKMSAPNIAEAACHMRMEQVGCAR